MTPTQTAAPKPTPPAANQHPILRVRGGAEGRNAEGNGPAVEIDHADADAGVEVACDEDACRGPLARPFSLHPADLVLLQQSISCIRLRAR